MPASGVGVHAGVGEAISAVGGGAAQEANRINTKNVTGSLSRMLGSSFFAFY